MARDRPSNLTLTLGLCASIAMHLFVMLPLLLGVLQQSTPRGVLNASFEPDMVDPPPSDDPLLGIDRQEPVSTMTWIGYEQYQQHIAELAAIEQAAFDLASQMPAPEQSELSEATPADSASAVVEEVSPDEVQPPQPMLSTELVSTLSNRVAELLQTLREVTANGIEVNESARDANDAAQAERVEVAQDKTDASDAAETANDQAAETPSPPQPATEPVIVEQPKPAEPSDRQSPATSVKVTFDQLKSGRPLAARGLELRPSRPEFTTLDRVTLWPRHNPLVQIGFGYDGRPLIADILESSGNERIDEAIRSSLFRWRASGSDLESLSGEATIDIQIRIVLRPELGPRD